MLFTIPEIIDIIAMTLIIGYIFKDIFKSKPTNNYEYDPLKPKRTNSHFWYAAITVGLSIVLHELGHKFVAMAMGLQATFHAAYGFLGFGLILKLMNVGFIFFVPAYVSHPVTTPINSAMIAIAGPGINLIIWLICGYIINNKLVKSKYLPLVHFTKYINGFLFIVNMLPIPGLDGYHFFRGLINSF